VLIIISICFGILAIGVFGSIGKAFHEMDKLEKDRAAREWKRYIKHCKMMQPIWEAYRKRDLVRKVYDAFLFAQERGLKMSKEFWQHYIEQIGLPPEYIDILPLIDE